MKRSLSLVIGGLLSFSMSLGAWQAVWGILPDTVRATNKLDPAVASAAQILCSEIFQEQPIPDDGSWLFVCLLDPSAPAESTVTEVNVEYILDHPSPDQLEVRITRPEGNVSSTLWELGKLVTGTNFGEATSLDVFKGTAAQGEWYLLVRDAVPGQAGWLRGATVRPDYETLGPLPEQLTGTVGRPTSRRIPPGAMESTYPDSDEKKPEAESQGSTLEPTAIWQVVKSETFEGAFPNTGWSVWDDNPGDGREYFWDDDDYRPHNGNWAAWPANGGANGLDPASSSYPPNMDSWMTYGPINLSNAKAIEVDF